MGGLSALFLKGVAADSMEGSIPETVFVMFRTTFANITPGLIVGAFVERMKFPVVMLFSVLWLILVYAPTVTVCGSAQAGYSTMESYMLREVLSFTQRPVHPPSFSRICLGPAPIFPVSSNLLTAPVLS